MIHYVNGDLLEDKYTIFCHQVNCCKVMNGGIAKQIREKYPEVYRVYKNRENPSIGMIDWITTNDNRVCINMYAQQNYGYGLRYTNYIAFSKCLVELALSLILVSEDVIVAFPYKIGCGLGGGDWTVISALIEDFAKMIKQDVYIIIKKEN